MWPKCVSVISCCSKTSKKKKHHRSIPLNKDRNVGLFLLTWLLTKLSNKQSNFCRWSQMPWGSFNVTVITKRRITPNLNAFFSKQLFHPILDGGFALISVLEGKRCTCYDPMILELSLHLRHNGCDGVSNHQPQDCLLNRLLRPRSNENNKAPRHWPLWPVNFLGCKHNVRQNFLFRTETFKTVPKYDIFTIFCCRIELHEYVEYA